MLEQYINVKGVEETRCADCKSRYGYGSSWRLVDGRFQHVCPNKPAQLGHYTPTPDELEPVPTEMQWTQELPIVPGWYWHWDEDAEDITIAKVWWEMGSATAEEVWWAQLYDELAYLLRYNVFFNNTWWQGPISPPEPPAIVKEQSA
jgi:hypothetical protein